MSDPKREERKRVQALLDLDTAGAAEEKMVREAIRSGASPGETARKLLESRKARRESELAARVADEQKMDAPRHSPGVNPEQDAAAAEAKQTIAAARRAGVLPPPGQGRQRVGEAGGAP